MEVNKDEAERCRDIAARALRQQQYERAVKFFKKSLSLYPLPGVDALLAQSERLAANGSGDGGTAAPQESSTSSTSTAGDGSRSRPSMPSRAESTASSTASIGASGRSYTPDQEEIVKKILRAKEGGRGAHYRILGIAADAGENDIKKAYRKMALKLHPDKNSAPHADEAFKAVGLAYATLSDTQKRNIYDRYGEEDPDNRGGGMRPGGGGGGVHFRPGQEVNPEDIFNMFFGGGMPGGGVRGGPGVHFYSTGFGGPRGGFQGAQFGRRQGGQRGGGGGGDGQRQQEPEPSPWQNFVQLMPFLLIMLLSFMNMSDSGTGTSASYGENKHFSLTQTDPFLNPLETKISSVKGIPYFVTNKFLRTYNRDRYQLAQVEKMVEGAYEKYLTTECNSQRAYKRSLLAEAEKKLTPEEQEKAKQIAKAFEFCVELNDLYPLRHSGKRR
eukprot:CAMPEP_0117018842 /NCGR_PEP_ID=MMETSP0472-20121206/14526_1 /TAXON_ID=693140 ORGANISM="Tiarina fusus, Strain LIS" /NCGR_SAMPLE_ID=MMETSP0472 /ASSEMBLY_ACC=CAM_ASM_000603 /LENGTH=441 /DNA_ID=CAMNT_0004723623 /DNA_START=30 /DNA_END=1355 /DNA_ORIENTATION=-